MYGYAALDALVKAASKTGPNLTTDALIRTMDAMTFIRSMFDKLYYGSAGSGSPTHLAALQLVQAAGFKATHVPVQRHCACRP